MDELDQRQTFNGGNENGRRMMSRVVEKKDRRECDCESASVSEACL